MFQNTNKFEAHIFLLKARSSLLLCSFYVMWLLLSSILAENNQPDREITAPASGERSLDSSEWKPGISLTANQIFQEID